MKIYEYSFDNGDYYENCHTSIFSLEKIEELDFKIIVAKALKALQATNKLVGYRTLAEAVCKMDNRFFVIDNVAFNVTVDEIGSCDCKHSPTTKASDNAFGQCINCHQCGHFEISINKR